LILCESSQLGVSGELVLHFDIVSSINRFRFNSSGKEVDVLESFSNIVSVKTKSGDRVSEQFTSILYECDLFGFNEVKYSLNSFNICGFVGNFIGPFDGITNKFGTTFDDIHNFIGSLSSGLDTSDDGDWVNKILHFNFSIIKVVFQSSQVDNGWLKHTWINHVVEIDQGLVVS